MIDLSHDGHVHSTYSDGRDDLEANVQAARQRGLDSMCLVDHVRADTDWLPDFVAEVATLDDEVAMTLTCGVEAKLLDDNGILDLPELPDGIDQILVADHQVPFAGDCHPPATVRRLLEDGVIEIAEIVESLLTAAGRAAERYERVTIAHLFSVLPKVGLDETSVSDSRIRSLGRRLQTAGARVEISERWRCPSLRVASILSTEGVPLVASTDSHRKETVGVYSFVADVARSLR